MYSTGNCILFLIITYYGKKAEKEYIYIYIYIIYIHLYIYFRGGSWDAGDIGVYLNMLS